MKILVFAPHNDDEVLGVGGTISKFVDQGHQVYICEVTGTGEAGMSKKVRDEALEAHKILGIKDAFFLGLPVVELCHVPINELNGKVAAVVDAVKPEIVFIPHKGDMHIDHKIVAESVMVALRPHTNPQLRAIYAYETLSETEWNFPSVENVFIPNVWSDITDYIEIKKQAMACYKSQLLEYPHPRSIEGIEALSKVRGSTVCVNNAEAFMLVRGMIRD